MALHLFAGVRVSDHDAASRWYSSLLGLEAFRANDVESVWDLGETTHLYVEQDADRAGHGVVTLFVDDLDAWLATARAGGHEPVLEETYPNGLRKAVFHDPDGNEIGLGWSPHPW